MGIRFHRQKNWRKLRFPNNFLFLFYLVLCVCYSRWPPLTAQANYSSVMMPQKSALPQSLQTLLPPSQGSQPEVAELETGQLTQSGQSREVRGGFCRTGGSSFLS